MAPMPRRRRLNRKGFALMVVIVVMLLATFLASQLILLVRTELAVSHNIKARAVGHFLAEAGVNLGIFRIYEPRPAEVPPLGPEEDWEQFIEGYQYTVYLPKGKVQYYVCSEAGKIDLNRAPPGLLELFLKYQLAADFDDPKEAEDKVAVIMDSWLDWRDSDDLHRLNGAESETYEALDDPYTARNGRIEDPSEFFLINGTDLLAGKFHAEDVFTVHSPNGRKINFNHLTPAMLAFFTGGDAGRIQQYYDAKVEYQGRLNAAVAAEVLGNLYEEFGPYLSYGTGKSKYYFIAGTGYADVTEEDDAARQDEGGDEDGHLPAAPDQPGTMDTVLIKKKGSSFQIISWRERNI